MAKQTLFFYSPLDPLRIKQKYAPSLLLQLIFQELIDANEYLTETDPINFMIPFNWIKKPGNKNKIKEYILLLKLAFPQLKKEIQHLSENLNQPCEKISLTLQPFIFNCKDNETLLFFLIKHQNHLNIKSLLNTLYPEGLTSIKRKILAEYHKRGFNLPKWTS